MDVYGLQIGHRCLRPFADDCPEANVILEGLNTAADRITRIPKGTVPICHVDWAHIVGEWSR
jgi:hypothetical protein